MKALFLLLTLLLTPAWGQASKPAAAPKWLESPYKPDGPAITASHSAQQVAAALMKAAPPRKSDFETEAQYRERLANWSAPLFGSVRTNDLLAFNVPRFGNLVDYEAKYSAEAQQWTAAFYTGGRYLGKTAATILVDRQGKDAGTYVGQNAFGVKKRISVQVIGQWQLGIDAPGGERFVATIDMPTDEAKKSILNILLVGKLKPPFRTAEKDENTATISDPREQTIITNTLHFDLQEVIIYELFTKRIIQRGPPGQFLKGFTGTTSITSAR